MKTTFKKIAIRALTVTAIASAALGTANAGVFIYGPRIVVPTVYVAHVAVAPVAGRWRPSQSTCSPAASCRCPSSTPTPAGPTWSPAAFATESSRPQGRVVRLVEDGAFTAPRLFRAGRERYLPAVIAHIPASHCSLIDLNNCASTRSPCSASVAVIASAIRSITSPGRFTRQCCIPNPTNVRRSG